MADGGVPVVTINKDEEKEYRKKSIGTQKEVAQNTGYFVKIASNLITGINNLGQKMGFSEETMTRAKDNLTNMLDLQKKSQKKTPKEKKKEKWIEKLRKNKIFEKIASGLKNLAEASSNLFFDILKFLLIMMIIDPKGKMLASIIRFFGGMVVWLIKMLAKMLPRIISSLVDVIKNVLPPVFAEVFGAISIALSNMFKAWAKKVGEDSIIGRIFLKLSKMFGKDGILYKFFQKVAKFSPIIFALIGIFAMIFKFWVILKPFLIFLSFLFQMVLMVITTIGSLVLALAGIPIAIFLIIKFRDKIINFFKWLGKKIWGAIQAIGLSFWNVLVSIKDLFVKLFVKFPLQLGIKLGVALKKFWKKFYKKFKKPIDFIKKMIDLYIAYMTFPYRMIWKILRPLVGKVQRYLKSLKKAFEGKGIKGVIDKLITDMKKLFASIGLEIKLFFSTISNFLMSRAHATEKGKRADFQTRQIASSYGISADRLKDISKKSSSAGLSGKELAIFETLQSGGLTGGNIEKKLKSMSEEQSETISKKVISSGKSFQKAETVSNKASSGN